MMHPHEGLHVREGAEWREEWARLDHAARSRIEGAVREGRALDDPEEAAMAVPYARRRTHRSIGFVWSAMGLVLLILLVTGNAPEPRTPLGIAQLAAAVIVGLVSGPRLVASARRSLRANQDLVDRTIAEMLADIRKR